MSDPEEATAASPPRSGDRPLVTVVLPTYERSDSLLRSVDSVLSQSWHHLELLIVDDFSRPELRPSPDQFPDPRVRVIWRERNGGVAAAQNTGLAEATAPLIAFIHSDDRWAPEKLAHQVPVLEGADPGVAGVESATERVRPQGATIAPARLRDRSWRDLLARRVKDLHIAGFLLRTQALRAVGGFDEGLRAFEDLDLLIRLAREHRFVFTDDVVAVLEQGGGDRLAASPWADRGREHLIAKYWDQVVEVFDEVPAGWHDWCLRVGLRALEEDRPRDARRHIVRSVGHRPTRWMPRGALLVASFGGDRVRRAAARTYRKAVYRRMRSRRGT